MKGLSSLPDPLFTSAESAKVLGSLGHNITEQTKDDASTFASIDINVEVDFICDLWVLAVVCTWIYGGIQNPNMLVSLNYYFEIELR